MEASGVSLVRDAKFCNFGPKCELRNLYTEEFRISRREVANSKSQRHFDS
ncbi:hypothetical protein PROFUN_15790 [Planoprotostelium fungivorum]|uniref:Uncharacterized protein n=1 Tax=Planoprotostelium fungivorum TaxID=1890364 RepID=A0A2P6MUI4_9EUKA|nr:hypothetical protein PROFUN_15790 [Planoprotostelium fungivorum]